MVAHRRRRAPGRDRDEADPKHSTNRSSRARRQGVACSAALCGECQARVLRRLRRCEPAHGWAAPVAWSRVPRSPAPRPARPGQRSRLDRDRVPALPVHELRGDLDGRAARGGAAPALRPCRDRDGAHALGDRAGARGGDPSQGLRVAGQLRGCDPVADASALGSCGARRARRRPPVAARRRAPGGADRDRPRTAVAADRAAVPSGICRGQCNALRDIVVCSPPMPSPPRWIHDGARRRMARTPPARHPFNPP